MSDIGFYFNRYLQPIDSWSIAKWSPFHSLFSNFSISPLVNRSTSFLSSILLIIKDACIQPLIFSKFFNSICWSMEAIGWVIVLWFNDESLYCNCLMTQSEIVDRMISEYAWCLPILTMFIHRVTQGVSCDFFFIVLTLFKWNPIEEKFMKWRVKKQ